MFTSSISSHSGIPWLCRQITSRYVYGDAVKHRGLIRVKDTQFGDLYKLGDIVESNTVRRLTGRCSGKQIEHEYRRGRNQAVGGVQCLYYRVYQDGNHISQFHCN